MGTFLSNLRRITHTKRFEATGGQPSSGSIMFAVADGQLKEACVWRFPEGDSPELITAGSVVNRLTLREALLAGLDDVVRFGKEFTRYEQQTNGSVCAYFADGTSTVGEVLVAADGVGSRIRQQFLPHARVIDTGLRWLGGKTLLTDETKPLLRAQLYQGFAGFVIGGETMPAMFLATVQFQREPNEAAAQLWSGLQFHDTDDYLMWGVIARREQLPCSDEELSAMNGAELRRVALEMTEGWPLSLRTLVHKCELEQTFFLTMRGSVPIEHWQTTNVTLLGDAIHAMPPSRGSGANTALRDASLLCCNLAAADRREKPLLQAIHDYEAETVRYGFDAVQASLRPLPQGDRNPFHPTGA